jgi:hypothetical protein
MFLNLAAFVSKRALNFAAAFGELLSQPRPRRGLARLRNNGKQIA